VAREIVRLTSKGQMTIPVEVRRRLGLEEGDALILTVHEDEIRLRKLEPFRPLASDDPIWEIIGAGESGLTDVSVHHDRYLAEGEVRRWRRG